MRSRKKAPVLPPGLQERQPVYRRLPADHAHPDPVRTASRGPPGRPAGHCPACVTTAVHDLERDTLAPSTAGFRSRSTTWPVPGDDRGPIAVAHAGGCPACRGSAGKAIPARQNQTRPLHLIHGGALSDSAWPCWHSAPPAGARYPCEGPVSRLLPRSRGRPQVMPVSER